MGAAYAGQDTLVRTVVPGLALVTAMAGVIVRMANAFVNLGTVEMIVGYGAVPRTATNVGTVRMGAVYVGQATLVMTVGVEPALGTAEAEVVVRMGHVSAMLDSVV